MKTYIGIADCYGIESFLPMEEANPMILQIRANANAHRHAVVYKIDVTPAQEKKIKSYITKQDFVGALEYIKKTIKYIDISKGREKSWNLIPNPDLDPWG